MPVQARTSRRLIQRAVADLFDAVRAMDADVWAATFASDGVALDAQRGDPIEGRRALRAYFEEFCEPFEQVRMTEERVFLARDEAAVKWSGWGLGIDARDVTFDGIFVLRVNGEGKISSLSMYANLPVIWRNSLITGVSSGSANPDLSHREASRAVHAGTDASMGTMPS